MDKVEFERGKSRIGLNSQSSYVYSFSSSSNLSSALVRYDFIDSSTEDVSRQAERGGWATEKMNIYTEHLFSLLGHNDSVHRRDFLGDRGPIHVIAASLQEETPSDVGGNAHPQGPSDPVRSAPIRPCVAARHDGQRGAITVDCVLQNIIRQGPAGVSGNNNRGMIWAAAFVVWHFLSKVIVKCRRHEADRILVVHPWAHFRHDFSQLLM